MGALALVFMIIGYVFVLITAIFGIIILIQAFKTDTTQGILCLCVPIYVFYWAFAKMQHEKKKMFLMGWLGGLIGYIIFFGLSGVFASMALSSGLNDLQNMYGTAMPGMTGMPGMPGMPGMTPFPGMTGMPMTAWPGTTQ